MVKLRWAINYKLVVRLSLSCIFRQMQNRNNGCSKRRGDSPLEGDEEHVDVDNAVTSTNRMFAKVRKYNTEKDLSIQSESE